MSASLIDKVPLFASLPAAEIDHLVSLATFSSYPADTMLFYEDAPGDRFYIVLSGEVAIIKALHTPEERMLGIRGGGEFVGEMSLLQPDGLRTASARTVTDAQVIELTRAHFDEMLHRNPTLAYDMLRVLGDRLRASHELTIRDLQAKNRQLARAYADVQSQNQRLAQAYADLEAAQEQIIAKETLERELQLAREIQESILPRSLPQLPGLDLGARMVAAREVAGDFFDVIPLGHGRLGLVVGDVCGKGMPAAIFMALTRSLLRVEVGRALAPDETLRGVNVHLQDMNAAGMFVTVIYGIVDLPTRTFTYARAGHELPLLWDAMGAPQDPARGLGHPLGILPDPAFDVQTLRLPPDGVLLLYSDGVTEATDERGEFFGSERLLAAVSAWVAAPAQRLCDDLVATLTAYHGAAPQADDITLLAARLR